MSDSQATADRPAKPLGRYQLRLRVFLCLPFIVVLVWWLAGLALDLRAFLIEMSQRRRNIQAAIASHEKEARSHQARAESAIPEQVAAWATGESRVPVRVTRPIGEVEIRDQKLLREHAARCAAYHRAMKQKYEEEAWFPWRPVEPDPTPPSDPELSYTRPIYCIGEYDPWLLVQSPNQAQPRKMSSPTRASRR